MARNLQGCKHDMCKAMAIEAQCKHCTAPQRVLLLPDPFPERRVHVWSVTILERRVRQQQGHEAVFMCGAL
eukprot:scaffold38638_cov31-Tisochrysis_lutea.AAC.2